MPLRALRSHDSTPYTALVAIPTFQASATIESTLESVASSIAARCGAGLPGERFVISVVDDASTDDTAERVAAFARASPFDLHLDVLPENRGRGFARNRAVAAAHSDLHLFLDHDDLFLTSHVGACLDALGKAAWADFAQTGVELDAPVHPDWTPRIAASLTQNLCVRAWAHALLGGFHDGPEVEEYGCDDVLYNRLLREFLRGVDVTARTVRFLRRPGNSFDRQYERKLSRPAAQAEVTLSPRQRELEAAVFRIHEARRCQVRARLRRLESSLRRPGVDTSGVEIEACRRGPRTREPV